MYHTYDAVQVEVPVEPSKAELERLEQEAKEQEAKKAADEAAEELEESKKRKVRFDPKLNKIKELQRKVDAVLNNETGKVARKKAFQKPAFEREKNEKTAASANVTMTGFQLTKSQSREIALDVNRRMASVNEYLKNLDK